LHILTAVRSDHFFKELLPLIKKIFQTFVCYGKNNFSYHQLINILWVWLANDMSIKNRNGNFYCFDIKASVYIAINNMSIIIFHKIQLPVDLKCPIYTSICEYNRTSRLFGFCVVCLYISFCHDRMLQCSCSFARNYCYTILFILCVNLWVFP
jgi:hypothetical protein